MKKIIYYLLFVLPFMLFACEEDSVRYEIEAPQNSVMGLQSSVDEVVLDQSLGNEIAVSFTWNEGLNRGEGTKLTYYFKMDVADNKFQTSIDKIELPEGVHTVSFTHKQLNAYLNKWGIESGLKVALEAEVIAEVSDSKIYMKPEISTVQFEVTGYYAAPKPLYIMGSALQVLDASTAVEMEEILSEQEYQWCGHLEVGDFKFIESQTSLFPSYTQGAETNSLIYNTEEANETLFHIDVPGYYVIKVDVMGLTISREMPQGIYDNIWIIGDATSAGWTIQNSIPLIKQDNFVFIYEGNLVSDGAGEFKFPVQLNGTSWDIPFIMPVENGTGLLGGDNRIEYVEVGGHDYKWHVSEQEEGTYRVLLDTYKMTISFEKLSDIEIPTIPDDVLYKNVWLVGDATDIGWTISESYPLTYVYEGAEKGTFVWEGDLKAGLFKFPLAMTGDFNVDYLMPRTVNEYHRATLAETKMKLVEAPIGDNDDLWEVSEAEAGRYKITMNVISMTISFERLN